MTRSASVQLPQTPPTDESRCGVVALLGAPNAGKSTLLNKLVGAKVSIVTHKVQTTRTRLRGVAIDGTAQIVLVDTPGIFSNMKRRFERAMVRAAWESADDADAVVFVYDAAKRKVDAETDSLMARLKGGNPRCYLVLNKIDRIPRERLLALAAHFDAAGVFEAIFMVSANTGDGVQDLKHTLAHRMPTGTWLYPEEQLSDLSLRLMAAELTREKLYLNLHDELPYSLTVDAEEWHEFDDGSVRIGQVVQVEREGQKKIVVGRNGETIRKVREQTQAELRKNLERPVHLFLFVKVHENWSEDPEWYRNMGLEYKT